MIPADSLSSRSESALISELCEMRKQLWQVIAAGKKVVAALPDKERMILLDAMIEAEGKLK